MALLPAFGQFSDAAAVAAVADDDDDDAPVNRRDAE